MALNFLNNGYFAGKVGIGTESPQAQLTLLTTMAAAPTTQIYLDVDGNNAVGGGCEIIFNTSATGGTLANYNAKITGTRSSANDGSSDLSFFTTLVTSANSPAVRMTIKDNGNVGIGTTSPNHKLHVRDNTVTNGTGTLLELQSEPIANGGSLNLDFRVSSANTANRYVARISGVREGSGALSQLQFWTESSGLNQRMTILSGGNVGIGTTSPDAKLVVKDDSNVVYDASAYQKTFRIEKKNTDGNDQFANIRFNVTGYEGQTTGEASIGVVQTSNASSGNLVFGTRHNGTRSEKMRISSTGALKLNTYTAGTLVSDASGNITVSSGGGAGGPYLPLAGGTMTGNLNINTSTNFPLLITGTNTNYTAIGIRNTGTGDAGIYMDGINGDFGGSDYAFIGQKDEGYLLYNIGSSSPLPYHVFTGGNVGIGTTSPESNLEVSDSTQATGATLSITNSHIGSWVTGDKIGSIDFRIDDTSTTQPVRAKIHAEGKTTGTYPSNSQLVFSTTNGNTISEKMRIDSAGNVGIGTTSPNYALDIEKDTGSLLNLYRPNSSTAAASFLDFSFNTANATEAVYARIRSDVEVNTNSAQGGDLSFHTANSGTVGEVMRLTQEGNVGIGTTSPSYKFTAYGSSTDSEIVASFGSANSQNEYTAIGLSGFIASNGATKAGLALKRTSLYGTGELHFLNNNTTDNSDMTLSDSKMTILGNGNVGIGTTSPTGILGIAKPSDVAYDGTSDSGQDTIGASVTITNTNTTVDSFAQINMQVSASSNRAVGRIVTIAKGSASSDMAFVTEKFGVRAEKMRIKDDGNVGIGTASPNVLGFLETGLNIAAGGSSSTTLQQAGLVISGSSDADDADDFGYLSFTNYQSTLSSDRVAEIRINKGGSNVNTGRFNFYTANGTALNESMVLGETGLLRLSQYGAGTLVTDASGNVTVSSGGGAGGPYLPLSAGSSYPLTGGLYIPSYIYHTGDENTLFGFAGQDIFIVNTGGGRRLTVTNTEATFENNLIVDSNVGIGTTSPLTKLHIAGTTDANIIRIENTATALSAGDTIGAIQFFNNDTTDDSPNVAASIYATAGASGGSGSLRFKTTEPGTEGDPATDTMIITNGGKVGIGTDDPAGLLEIAGNTDSSNQFLIITDEDTTAGSSRPSIRFRDQNTQIAQIVALDTGVANEGKLRFSTGNNEDSKLEIIANGNVGIGTTAPLTKLHAQGVVTIKGSGTGTSGSLAIQDNYGITDHLGNIGWNRSSGGPYLAYGIKQDGSADWKSTFDNFSGMRTYMKLDNDEMQLAWAPAQQTTVDDVITGLLQRFTFKLDSGTLKLNAYDSTNKTGTPTYLLGTDASGNVVKTLSTPGGDPGPYLPLVGGTLTGALAGTSASFTGDLNLTYAYPRINLTDTNNDSDYSIINNNGAFSIYDVTNNSHRLSISATGNATFAGDITVSGGDLNVGNSSTVNSVINMLGTNNSFIEKDTGADLYFANNVGDKDIKFRVKDDTTNVIALTIDGSEGGDATFAAQAFSAATSSSDASSTLTTKGYVDGLITGATIYRGTWQAGISATSTGTTSSSTTLTVSAAILDAAGNTPTLVGAVVTGAGITGTVKVASVTSSTVYVLDTAISATASAYIFSPIYGAPDLSGVTQTSGYYYICSEAGSATPNGASTEPNTWSVGDWVIWNDDIGSGEWQKVDNSSVLSGVGTGQTVALWEGPSSVTDSETLGNAPITVNGNNSTFAGRVMADTHFQSSDTNATLSATGTGNVYLRPNGYSTTIGQVHIDTSGNATFAGDVIMSKNAGPVLNMNTNTSGNTSKILLHEGTTASPANGASIKYDGSANTFKIGVGSSVDTTRLTIDRATGLATFANNVSVTGNVGIGTTSPVATLDITKITPSVTTFYPYLQLSQRGTVANSKTGISFRNTEYNWDMGHIATERQGSSNSFDLVFYTANAGADGEGLRIDHLGNVGIGTTSPVGNLFVGPTWSQTGGNDLYIKSQTTTTSYDPSVNNTQDLGITYNTSSTTTTGPDKAGLVLHNDAGVAGEFSPMIIFSGREATPSQFKAAMAGIYARSPLGTGNGGSYIDGELIFATAGAATQGIVQRMVINKEGLVGIGTTNPQSKLQVAGGIQMADDTATASATKVGTMRYRTGTEYVEVDGVDLADGWTFTSGWNAFGGGTSITNSTTFVSASGQGIYAGLGLTTSKTYKVVIAGTQPSGGYISIKAGTTGTSFGNISEQSFDKVLYATLTTVSGNTNSFYIRLADHASNTSIVITKLEIQEVTLEDASYADMCMQTGASTYEWVNIVRNTY